MLFMKKKEFFAGYLIFFITLFSFSDSYASDWIFYASTNDDKCEEYYNSDITSLKNNNIKRVWRKKVGDCPLRMAKHEILLLDCKYKKFGLIYGSQDADVDPNGDKVWWSVITPDTIGDLLYKLICK